MKHRITLVFYAMLAVVSCKKHDATVVVPINKQFTPSTNLSTNDNVPSFCIDNSKVIEITVPSSKEPYDFSDYILSYHYVHLETNEKSLLGNIDKLCTDSSILFVFDKQNESVLRFSTEGEFLGKIGNKGRGMGEYVKLQDIAIDKLSHKVCLLDLAGGKQLYYDYNGRFLEEQPLYYYYNRFEFLKEKQVLSTSFSNNNNYSTIDCHRLLLSKRNQQPILKGFSYPESLRENFHWVSFCPLSTYDGRVFYHHILSDTIWEIADTSCIARYVIDFDKNRNLSNIRNQSKVTDELFVSTIDKNTYFFGKYLQNKDLLYLSFADPNHIANQLFYSKRTGKILYGSPFSLSEDRFLSKIQCHDLDYSFSNNTFVKVIQPFQVLRILKELNTANEKIEYTQKDKDFIQKLQEEDNPVLLILKMKPF